MSEVTINAVLELFEKHRKVPGSEFDQEHFFDFLIKAPKGKGTFRNSFSGLRRFNAFWDEVQLKFGVCFSIKDRDSSYSLNDFCARIEELQKSKRSSKDSLRNRAKYGFEWNIFVFCNVVLIGLAVLVNSINLLPPFVWLGIAYLNYKLVSSHLNEKCYIKALEAKIQNEANI
jgi:hypothetical protein